MLAPILAAAVGLAALFDLRDGRIPNALTYAMVACGLVAGLLEGAVGAHVAGLALGLVPGILLWRHGTLGAGDAKLLAGVGALTGPAFVVHTWLWSYVFALAFLLARAAQRRALWSTLKVLLVCVASPLVPGLSPPSLGDRLGCTMPLAPAVACGSLLLLATGAA